MNKGTERALSLWQQAGLPSYSLSGTYERLWCPSAYLCSNATIVGNEGWIFSTGILPGDHSHPPIGKETKKQRSHISVEAIELTPCPHRATGWSGQCESKVSLIALTAIEYLKVAQWSQWLVTVQAMVNNYQTSSLDRVGLHSPLAGWAGYNQGSHIHGWDNWAYTWHVTLHWLCPWNVKELISLNRDYLSFCPLSAMAL